MGTLNYPYVICIGVFQVLASYLGVTQVNRLVKITGRQSIIVIVLAFVLFISFISLPIKYLIK
jgi:hypothetical protein